MRKLIIIAMMLLCAACEIEQPYRVYHPGGYYHHEWHEHWHDRD